MGKLRAFAAACFVLLAIPLAYATQQFQSADDGSSIGSVVVQCLNGSGKAVPMTSAGQCIGSGGSVSVAGFNPNAVFPVAASTSSARQQLTGTGTSIVIDNSANTAKLYVAFGTSTVTASSSNFAVPPGAIWGFDSGGAGYVAVLLASGSGNVSVSQGSGLPPSVPGDQAALGTPADGAYTGSGNATAVAALKGLYAQATNPVPCKAAATWNASTGLTGTQPTGCDGSAALWGDIGAVGGTAVPKAGLPILNGGNIYNTIAASQTAQVLSSTQGGGTGAVGDYLSHCDIIPATTSPGAVSLTDGSGSAITLFAGGASSISNLVPFPIPVGALSISGGWKITTGTSVSAVCFGKFT